MNSLGRLAAITTFTLGTAYAHETNPALDAKVLALRENLLEQADVDSVKLPKGKILSGNSGHDDHAGWRQSSEMVLDITSLKPSDRAQLRRAARKSEALHEVNGTQYTSCYTNVLEERFYPGNGGNIKIDCNQYAVFTSEQEAAFRAEYEKTEQVSLAAVKKCESDTFVVPRFYKTPYQSYTFPNFSGTIMPDEARSPVDILTITNRFTLDQAGDANRLPASTSECLTTELSSVGSTLPTHCKASLEKTGGVDGFDLFLRCDLAGPFQQTPPPLR